MDTTNDIIIYQTPDNQIVLEVSVEHDTVWLNQMQMSDLFDQTKQNISLHIKNIFKEKELNADSVVKESLTTAKDGKNYKTKLYNLDVIISVGYRVKSQRGTHFRIWATQTLKEHLIKGYTLNQKRLTEQNQKFIDLQKSITLINKTIQNKSLPVEDTRGLVEVLNEFSYALSVLDGYDHSSLTISDVTTKEYYRLMYDECQSIIREMKQTFSSSDIFGVEKDDSFKGSIGNIYQTFEGQELYPSVEEKAAHLLYFITKNHSFVDGNKRIAASIFVYFLEKNKILHNNVGTKRISDSALVAMTIMIAESKPDEKDIIIKVIVNLINKNN